MLNPRAAKLMRTAYASQKKYFVQLISTSANYKISQKTTVVVLSTTAMTTTTIK